ncbi:MAG TPA: putative Ig domain-containing protein, partial [Burkholderiales bacterium]
ILARPDGGVPVAATILFGPGISPSDIVLANDEGGWAAGFGVDGQIAFQGALASWTAIDARFADGTQWTHDDFLARAPALSSSAPLTQGTAGNDFFVGTAAAEHFAGGAGDDVYVLAPGGGQDSIEDRAGNDTLGFFGVRSDEASVHRDAQDYLIDYPGGEVRLVSQADATQGVEALFFQGDAAIWSRADLDARAGGAPVEPVAQTTDQDPLGVRSAAVGQPFSYTLPSDAFAQEHPAGAATFDAATLEGPLPAWLSVDHHTGTLTGTPAAGDAGVSTLLIAMKDDDKLLTVRPLALVVEAPNAPRAPDATPDNATAPSPSALPDPAPTSVSASADAASSTTSDSHASSSASADTPAQTSQLSVPEAQPPAPATASTPAESSTLAAEAAIHQAFTPAPPVGVIHDAVYERIGSLLFSPATLHASSFMDRYSESVQQFQEREAAPQDSVPAPSEEEIGAYNAVLHAWLDEDMSRLSALEASDARDQGAPEIRYAESASALERLLGISQDSFARPGLRESQSLQPRPTLQEGFSQLGS